MLLDLFNSLLILWSNSLKLVIIKSNDEQRKRKEESLLILPDFSVELPERPPPTCVNLCSLFDVFVIWLRYFTLWDFYYLMAIR